MATLTLTKTSGLNLLHACTTTSGRSRAATGCSSDTGTYPVGTVVILTEQTPGLLVFQRLVGRVLGHRRRPAPS